MQFPQTSFAMAFEMAAKKQKEQEEQKQAETAALFPEPVNPAKPPVAVAKGLMAKLNHAMRRRQRLKLRGLDIDPGWVPIDELNLDADEAKVFAEFSEFYDGKRWMCMDAIGRMMMRAC